MDPANIASQKPGERVLSASRRKCEWCHREFEPLRKWQRFHSPRCRKAAFDQPMKDRVIAAELLKALKQMLEAHSGIHAVDACVSCSKAEALIGQYEGMKP